MIKYKRVDYGGTAPTESDLQDEYKKGYILISVTSKDNPQQYYGYFSYSGGIGKQNN